MIWLARRRLYTLPDSSGYFPPVDLAEDRLLAGAVEIVVCAAGI